MSEIKIHDIVKTTITGCDIHEWMVIGLGDKDGQSVVDLAAAGDQDHRWQYLDRVEFVGHGDPIVWGIPTAPTMCAKHPAFEIDYCPGCGTVPDLSAPVDEPAVEPLWQRIRSLRESKGLSRRDVQVDTGLSASVIWRAEQPGKDVGDENVTKIWDFLNGAQAKTTRRRPAETTTGEALQEIALANQVRDEWMAKTWELRGVIDEALAELDRQIDESYKLKRPLAPLRAVRKIIAEHGTTR